VSIEADITHVQSKHKALYHWTRHQLENSM